MARAPQEREVERDRSDRTTDAGRTVMVGGMDDLVGDADQPLKIEIETPRREERREERQPQRLRADVELDDDEQDRRDRGRDEDSRLAYDVDADGVDERRSRRARRNQSHRRAMAEKDGRIADLTQRIDQLTGMVQGLTQGQTGLTMGTIDTQLSAAQHALSLADDELAKAVAESNGPKYREVQKIRDEAAARVFQLANTKQGLINEQRRFAANNGGPPRAPQPQSQPGLSPKAQEFAEIFMSRYSYYDPNGNDEDTAVMKAIDDAVMAEGYRPDTPLYWTTLEKRLAARGFYPVDADGNEINDRDDEKPPPPRRAQNNSHGGLPPSSGGNGSSRRRNGSETFTIDPMARQYLETEGLLEPNLTDAQKQRRDRLIRNWRDYAQRAKRGEFART